MIPENYTNLDSNYSRTWTKLDLPSDIQPKDYLAFANKDISSSDEPRSLVNALSNAKRALHFQIEVLTNEFGISHYYKKPKNINFHNRLEYCEKCGIVSPRILKKLNRVRNAVEHDYYLPQKEEVEDYLDIVELFLAATSRFFHQFPSEIEFLSEKLIDSVPDISYVVFLPEKGAIHLQTGLDKTNGKNEWLYEEILAPTDEFFSWVKFLVNNSV